jgi:hypothetical protein
MNPEITQFDKMLIVTSLQLLIPVIQTIFFRCRDFQSAEIKSLLFRPKLQKFHSAEINGYTVRYYSNFNCSYITMSSLTYIPGFSVEYFVQPIYTDYAN